jgi:hypothetical protein
VEAEGGVGTGAGQVDDEGSMSRGPPPSATIVGAILTVLLPFMLAGDARVGVPLLDELSKLMELTPVSIPSIPCPCSPSVPGLVGSILIGESTSVVSESGAVDELRTRRKRDSSLRQVQPVHEIARREGSSRAS